MELSKVTLEIFSKLEQKWLHHSESNKTRVLTIDGGGTTADVAGASLIHLENQIQQKTNDPNSKIADFFDIIAGTGIGALFAAMLVSDNGHGRPLYSAREAVDFLLKNQQKLFKIRRVGVLRRQTQYSGKSMDAALKAVFRRADGGVLTMKDTCKPLLVPCYDLNTSAPFVFSRADALESPSFDFEMWRVVRAAMATPPMFKPFQFTSVDGKISCLAIDGGVVMNNPTAATITHVLHNKREFSSVSTVDDLLVLSIGNGRMNSPSEKIHDFNVVGIALDGISETVDQMLGNVFCWTPNNYVRIQANGKSGNVLSERAVESLPFGAKRLLTETQGQRMESFVQRLAAAEGRSNVSLPPTPYAVSPLVNGR